VEHIKKLRDLFNVKTYIETGTFKGIGARFWSNHFQEVLTCEINKEFIKSASKKFQGKTNIILTEKSSPDFLRRFKEDYHKEKRNDIVIIYLDAHFYDPKAENKFIVLEELKALRNFKNCIIIIHDFDNNLGHITYDGQPLNLELIKEDLMNVNPEFKLYTNELASCDIIKHPDDLEDLEDDFDTRDNIVYAWSSPEKTYRGILYAIPEKVNIGLKEV